MEGPPPGAALPPGLAAFATRLRGLTDGSAAAISKLSQYTVLQARAAPAVAPRQLAGVWLRELMSCASPDRQLVLLYLANDFLQQTKRTPELLLAPFAGVLPRALAAIGARSLEQADKARRVVSIWRERGVYPPIDCDAFEAALAAGSADAGVQLAVASAGDDAAVAATAGRSRIAGLDDEEDGGEEAASSSGGHAAAAAAAAPSTPHFAEHDATEIVDLLLGTRTGVAAATAAGEGAGEGGSPDADGRLSPLAIVEAHVLPAVGARVAGLPVGRNGKQVVPPNAAAAAQAAAAAAVAAALSDAPSTALEQALQRLERAEVDTSFSKEGAALAAALAEAAFVAGDDEGAALAGGPASGAGSAPFPPPGPHAALATLRRYAAALAHEKQVREGLVSQLSAYIDAQASAGEGDDADVSSALAVLANVRAARRALAAAAAAPLPAPSPQRQPGMVTAPLGGPVAGPAAVSPRRSGGSDELGAPGPGTAPLPPHPYHQAYPPPQQPYGGLPSGTAPSHPAPPPAPYVVPPYASTAPPAAPPAYGAAASGGPIPPYASLASAAPPAYGSGAGHAPLGLGYQGARGGPPPATSAPPPPPPPPAYGGGAGYGAPAYGAPSYYGGEGYGGAPPGPPATSYRPPAPPAAAPYGAPGYPPMQGGGGYAQPPPGVVGGYNRPPPPQAAAAGGSVPGARGGAAPAPAAAGRGMNMTIPAWMKQG